MLSEIEFDNICGDGHNETYPPVSFKILTSLNLRYFCDFKKLSPWFSLASPYISCVNFVMISWQAVWEEQWWLKSGLGLRKIWRDRLHILFMCCSAFPQICRVFPLLVWFLSISFSLRNRDRSVSFFSLWGQTERGDKAFTIAPTNQWTLDTHLLKYFPSTHWSTAKESRFPC